MTAMPFINVRPIIKVGGEEDQDLQEAITAFVVNRPLNGMAHAEITLTNWVPGESGEMHYGFQAATLGTELEIMMDSEQTIFKGEITAVEERYGEGAPQLILLVQDKLHRLVRQRNCRTFEDMSIDDVVQSVASGLGLSVDVSVSTVTSTWHQINESDLAFLNRICGDHNIALRIDGDSLRVKAEEADAEPLELSAQDSALSVRLIADLNHQAKKIKVNGFNVGTDEETQTEKTAMASAPENTTAADVLNELGWPGEDIVPQPFPRSQGENDELGQAHFDRIAKRFVSGDISCQGEASLKSGREIELSGVSERFTGKYQIVHCVHRFDSAGGYETHLKVNRADWQA